MFYITNNPKLTLSWEQKGNGKRIGNTYRKEKIAPPPLRLMEISKVLLYLNETKRENNMYIRIIQMYNLCHI